jgi:hypothetical protein
MMQVIRRIALRLANFPLTFSARTTRQCSANERHLFASVKRLNGLALSSLIGVTLTLPITACSGAPSAYSSEAINSKIVDFDTKEPLAGVIVVAHWELEVGSPGGSRPIGQLKVMETVTDEQGQFHFPAWGPLKRRQGVLADKDPIILLFKPGYEYRALQRPLNSKWLEESWKLALRPTDWVPGVVELKRFADRPINIGEHGYQTSAYAEHLSHLSTSLETVAMDDCRWKEMPRMLLALRAQKNEFRKQGIRFSLIGADSISANAKKCGSPEDLFRNYRP